jgi:hypothetical protein
VLTGCNGTLPLCGSKSNIRVQQLSGEMARLTIYRAFIECDLEVPKHLAREVHELYFNPQHEEFAPRTMWSLSNAFTSSFKELDPIPKFNATAKLREFLEARVLAILLASRRYRSGRRFVVWLTLATVTIPLGFLSSPYRPASGVDRAARFQPNFV